MHTICEPGSNPYPGLASVNTLGHHLFVAARDWARTEIESPGERIRVSSLCSERMIMRRD
jgi:hypothetical protein